MKIFISQPMRGRFVKEIIETRTEMHKAVCKILGTTNENTTVLETYFPDGMRTNPVKMLGESIKKLAEADVVIFAPGWQEARGCRIEQEVCRSYDIRYIDYELWAATDGGDEAPESLKPVDIKLEDIEEDSEAARCEETLSDIEPDRDMEIKRSPLDVDSEVEILKKQLSSTQSAINNFFKCFRGDESSANTLCELLSAQREIIAQMDALYYGDEM